MKREQANTLGLALSVLVLGACAPAPSAPTPAAPPSAAPPPATASAEPVAPVPPPSPLSIFTEGWEVTVADTYGPVVIHDALLGAMVTVEGERVTRVEAPFQRLPTGVGVSGTITGTWPEGALLTTRVDRALQQFFRRTKDAWEVQRVTDAYGHGYFREAYIRDADGETYHVAGPNWPNLGVWDVAGPGGRSLVFMEPTGPEHPVFSLGGDGKPKVLGSLSMDAKRAGIAQVAATRSGDIAVLARYLYETSTDRGWLVERWRVGQTVHALTEVEGTRAATSDDEPAVSICLSPDGALHAVRYRKKPGASALLTLRGTSWSVTEVPGTHTKGPTSRCAVGRDGSVWFLLDDGKELCRVSPDRAVERIHYPNLPPPTRRLRIAATHAATEPVPAAGQIAGTFRGTHLQVAEDGSLWVAGFRSEAGKVVDTGSGGLRFQRRVVLRLGAALPGTPIDWDDLQAGIIAGQLATELAGGGHDTQAYFTTGPVQPGCKPVFARLLTLPKKPPPGEDFPAVRAAVQGRKDLAGIHIVEGRVANEPVLGALAPDLEAGRRILSALTGKGHLLGAGARLYCGRPHVVRAIPMGIPDE